MKRPSSARQRLSRLLGGVEFGVGKASSPTVPEDKADAGPVRPDVFGTGEGNESWIRNSRESAAVHEGPPSSDTQAGHEAATAIREVKHKRRKFGLRPRPTSMIWLGPNREKTRDAAEQGKRSTSLALVPSSKPPPSNDSGSWSMLNAGASGTVGNHEGLRIITLPPPPAVGVTVDVPRSRKSQSQTHRRSVVVVSGGEESETEVGQIKGRRSSFLGAFIRK
jgi:hypothetical protein